MIKTRIGVFAWKANTVYIPDSLVAKWSILYERGLVVFTQFYEWFDHVHLHFLNQNKSSAKLALLGQMFYEHKKLMVVRCSADKFYNFLNNLTRDLILQKH